MAADGKWVKFESHTMNIGIPTEVKPQEGRVALTPADCALLVAQQHRVHLQSGAGELSGYADALYENQGVHIQPDAESLYRAAELIVKVKEPVGSDLRWLESRHTLFCYLHLAADLDLTQKLLDRGLTAVAFETVVDNGKLPLLKPMSEVAGKLAVQIGTGLLHQPAGGRGVLLGGVGESEPGQVTVLGAGVAGGASALLASAMGAEVWVFDKSPEALAALQQRDPRIQTISYNEQQLLERLRDTDLLVGAVLIKGARAPRLVSREMVASMPDGSVLVDISVDQGGCIETTRATTYDAPTYVCEGVTHFCVSNMPGAVPRSASQAISAVLPPYIERLTRQNWLQDDAQMRAAVNLSDGAVYLEALHELIQ